MLKPSQFRTLLPRRCVRTQTPPQHFQSQCRRIQSSSSRHTPHEPHHPSRSTQDLHAHTHDAHPPPLLQPTLTSPRFERAPSETFAIPPPKGDTSIHPALAGFIAGSMMAFALSYAAFHFSGSYQVRRAADKNGALLHAERRRLLGLPYAHSVLRLERVEPGAVAVEEAVDWLGRATLYYTAFMPNSDIYVASRWKEVEQVVSAGGKDRRAQVLSIVLECARELEAEQGNAVVELVGWYTGRKRWDVVRRGMDRIANLGESGGEEKFTVRQLK